MVPFKMFADPCVMFPNGQRQDRSSFRCYGYGAILLLFAMYNFIMQVFLRKSFIMMLKQFPIVITDILILKSVRVCIRNFPVLLHGNPLRVIYCSN